MYLHIGNLGTKLSYKLLSLVNQGLVEPSEWSIATRKHLHNEWQQKPFKSFAQIFCLNVGGINDDDEYID
jgi:hypothetical protein